ncbi:MAG TPA: hypothetical protein VFH31_07745, partial [Pyrinomonadaceae bacterium]|nr:hypothetical protein [Pyrinomonadaceae bacterium]
MKVYLALPLCLLWSCATVAAPGVARDNPLFDSYGDISFKAEKLRLNNYAIQLQNTPGSRGLIIVYSGGPWTAEEVKARARRAAIYLVKKRGISADRLKWRYEGRCRQGSVLLYL